MCWTSEREKNRVWNLSERGQLVERDSLIASWSLSSSHILCGSGICLIITYHPFIPGDRGGTTASQPLFLLSSLISFASLYMFANMNNSPPAVRTFIHFYIILQLKIQYKPLTCFSTSVLNPVCFWVYSTELGLLHVIQWIDYIIHLLTDTLKICR